MSWPLLIPPWGRHDCYHCAAWRRWWNIGVLHENGVYLGRKPLGQCRTAPPTIDPDAIGSGNATWPVVGADDLVPRLPQARRQSERGRRMSAVILPFAPVRTVEVICGFGQWWVRIRAHGRLQRVFRRSNRQAAAKVAERIQRLDRIPAPRPCLPLNHGGTRE